MEIQIATEVNALREQPALRYSVRMLPDEWRLPAACSAGEIYPLVKSPPPHPKPGRNSRNLEGGRPEEVHLRRWRALQPFPAVPAARGPRNLG